MPPNPASPGSMQLIDRSFARRWQAEILPARPAILPPRRYVFPRDAEEVEKGALEILIHPLEDASFLATCALGFRDPAAPTGVWSCPRAEELCAVSGGYAYIIDSRNPERFTMLELRPVLVVRPVPALDLLLFVGHLSILAWGRAGQMWHSGRLSDEGVAIRAIDGLTLEGAGWKMMTDEETLFRLDLGTGQLLG
jgi:hypothetical protein